MTSSSLPDYLDFLQCLKSVNFYSPPTYKLVYNEHDKRLYNIQWSKRVLSCAGSFKTESIVGRIGDRDATGLLTAIAVDCRVQCVVAVWATRRTLLYRVMAIDFIVTLMP